MTPVCDVAARTIVITGAAGLLGREYARTLVGAGAQVVLADIDAEAADRQARALGPHTLGVGVDVGDEGSVRRLVRTALDRFGRIDGLVNNAAIDPKVGGAETALAGAFEDYPLAAWNESLAVNITGMFLCCREVAPAMLAQKHGVIVNVSSTYGLVGPDQRLYEPDVPGGPRAFKPVTYSVTKSAALGLTRYLAAYWGGTGIRVNTLTPGGVRHEQPESFVERYAARTPLGRMAERDEYCGALLFLLSEASSYMTGSNLVVDGGWTAW